MKREEGVPHAGPKRLLPWLLAGIFFIGLLPLFFWKVFFIEGGFYHSRLLLQTMPGGEFAVQWLHAGILPLWNPHIFCGYPWMADPAAAVFYPFHQVFFLLAEGPRALHWTVLFHFWLAGLFMFALASAYKLRTIPSLAAGSLFMFNGFIVGYHEHPAALRTIVWLPLLLYCLKNGAARLPLPIPTRRDRDASEAAPACAASEAGRQPHTNETLRPACPKPSQESRDSTTGNAGNRSAAWHLAAGLVLGTLLLGCHPPTAFLVAVASFFYYLYVETRFERFSWRQDGTRLALRWTALMLAGFGIAAVQWLPAWELTHYAAQPSSSGNNFPGQPGDFLSPSFLIKWVTPNLDGGPADAVMPIFVGCVSILLSILALASPQRNTAAFFLATLIASLLLMVVAHTTIFRMVSGLLPGILRWRPLETGFLVILALSMLAALGLEAVLCASSEQQKRWAIYLGLVWTNLVLLTALFYARRLYLADLPWDERGVLGLPQFKFLMMDLLILLPGLMLVAWLACPRSVAGPGLKAAGMLFLLVLNLFAFSGLEAVEVAPESIHDPNPELIKAIAGAPHSGRVYAHPALLDDFFTYSYSCRKETMGLTDKVETWNNDGLVGNSPARFGLDAVSGCSDFPLRGWAEFTQVRRAWPEEGGPGRIGRETEFLRYPEMLRRLGCSWVLMPPWLPLQEALRDHWILAWKTPTVHAYFNGSVEAWPLVSANPALRVKDSEPSGLPKPDAKTTEAPGNPENELDWPSAEEARLARSFRRSSPNEMELELDAGPIREVFFREAFFPGWQVWAGGIRCEVNRSSYFLLAARLPETESRQVTAAYLPFSFKLGLFMSLVTLSILAGVFVLRCGRLFLGS